MEKQTPMQNLLQNLKAGQLTERENLMDYVKHSIKSERDHFANCGKCPTDEEIENEAEKRYGEITGGQYHASRPIDKARFIKGAKWAVEFMKRKYKEEVHF